MAKLPFPFKKTNKPFPLAVGHLPKTGKMYHVVLQTPQHIDDILTLQKKVYASLSPAEKPFLSPKDKKFFENHFAHGGHVMGIYCDGKLIAQSIIIHPHHKNQKTGMVDMKLPASAKKLSVLQGVIVDPNYRGNKLMETMVQIWVDFSNHHGRTHLIAEVAVDNFYSWGTFIKQGIGIHSMGLDQSDGTVLYNMHAKTTHAIKNKLKTDFNQSAKKKIKLCPQSDHKQQKELFKKGYKAIAFADKGKTLLFKK